MLRLFKSKRAEKRSGVPAFAISQHIDDIVADLRRLVGIVPRLRIADEGQRYSIYLRIGGRDVRAFELYKPPHKNPRGFNIVQLSEDAPLSVDQAVLRYRHP